MKQKHTDKKLLLKGLKYMGITLPLILLSPYLITLSFLNKENWSFYLFITLGSVIGILGIYFFFKGIKTILDSIF